MTTQTPDPLVNSDVDLSGFGGFFLNVEKLLSSELVALGTPEECWYAVKLWCRAWQQKPPASLPNDDRILASFSGAGSRWKKVRDVALRGFVLCSDGRLYNKTLAEEANAAWERRKKYRERSEKGNSKRWSKDSKKDGVDTESTHPHGDNKDSTWTNQGDQVDSFKDPSRMQEGSQKDSLDDRVEGEVEGKENNYSVPNGTDAGGVRQKVTDPNEIIFGYGVPMLTNAGTPEKQARSFLGGLRKVHGDDALIAKLRDCLVEKPLQPLEWLAAALPPVAKRSGQARHNGFEKTDYRKGIADDGTFGY